MNLYKVNLNLLIAFDAMMQTRHVSKAAAKCFISQSAMSNSLNQCRELFQDELFIRTSEEMKPTPKALELTGPVREAIHKIELVFEQSSVFDPCKSEICFRLGVSDYLCATILPEIFKHIRRHAPNVTFDIFPIASAQQLNALDEDTVDLVLGFFVTLPDRVFQQTIFHDEAVIVGCAKNPIFNKKITLKSWRESEHIRTLYHNESVLSAFDKYLNEQNIPERKIVMSVPYAVSNLQMLSQTPYLATSSMLLFNTFAKSFKLKSSPPPFKMPKIPIRQVWHKQHHKTPAVVWLRQKIFELFDGG